MCFYVMPRIFSQPKQNQSCVTPGSPEGKKNACFKEERFLLYCLLLPDGESVTFVLANTISRLLCNLLCRIWHAIKKAAFVQTRFLIHYKSVRLCYVSSLWIQ